MPWSDFKTTAKKGVPVTESRKAPSFSRKPRRTSLQDSIRKQEDLVLDVWSSETAFKVGGVVAVAFMAFIVVTALQSS
ncbi:hypothetical protein WJX81_000624 [Elliptochloris bilobata]|uniref:Uncharacterized protein n=1 Tax=Elliptochloris bilobata TaxID=381761 RepID=A0AAW1QMF6_9CHLO